MARYNKFDVPGTMLCPGSEMRKHEGEKDCLDTSLLPPKSIPSGGMFWL